MSTQGGPSGQPSPEELSAMLAERLARTPVRDVLLQTMATFTDMAGIKLGLGPHGDEVRDLTQARQAIETLRVLLSVAERELGAAQVRPFKEPLALLQMAYARTVEEGPRGGPEGEERPGDDPEAGPPPQGPPGGGPPPPSPPPPPGQEPGGPPSPDDPASRLWVPPGTRR
jgi:hypothetical protein